MVASSLPWYRMYFQTAIPTAENKDCYSWKQREEDMLNIRRLEEVIELIRTEMFSQLQQAEYNFKEERVIRISQKLDRLLNMYYYRSSKKD
jgi:hypothetical protein